MNRLWSGMLLLGIAYGAFCGKLPEVTDGALRASKEAVVLAISLLGVTGLWSGLMEIAGKAGMIDSLVLGIGINVTTPPEVFPPEVRQIGCHKYDL